ncbi:hypothetical protein [Photobacterium toruni]|uniref:Head processing protein n=1 Tax=Photobacterium toruni TaxID=1935446 RepID=A0A1T4UK21_9GAMM|nr:hypothetical protein [Photobacterium toruni]SKA52918.1 hypothetical protein CZ814_03367 [Photobacterium toruni]
MSNGLQKIELKFNIFDTGREYTGQQRGYILANVKQVINSPLVQERLRLREMVGYVGHGLREMAGKLTLGEKVSVKMANGQMMVVDAIPSNVTIDMSIDDDGNLTHTQEVLNNNEGQKLLGLHNSKIGGFSWAAGGGKVGENTIISDLLGFDYVHNPLFSSNRGYVLDSADNDTYDREAILDNLTAAGVNTEQREMVLDTFTASAVFEAAQYREQLFASQQVIADQHEKQSELQLLLDSATNETDILKNTLATRNDLFKQLQNTSLLNINDKVLDALINMNSPDHAEIVRNLLLDAASIDTSQLPIGTHKPLYAKRNIEKEFGYGDVESALDRGMYD